MVNFKGLLLLLIVISSLHKSESTKRRFPHFPYALRRINLQPDDNNCICFPKLEKIDLVANLIDPRNHGSERLVVYFYKDVVTKEIKMYVPNIHRQNIIPDLPFETGENVITIGASDTVKHIFNSNPNKIVVNTNVNENDNDVVQVVNIDQPIDVDESATAAPIGMNIGEIETEPIKDNVEPIINDNSGDITETTNVHDDHSSPSNNGQDNEIVSDIDTKIPDHLAKHTITPDHTVHSVDVAGNTINIPGNINDGPSNIIDVPDNTIDNPGYVIDMSGNVINVPGNTIDIPGNINNIHGNVIDIPGSVNNMPGININVPDNAIDITGNTIEVPGNGFDIPGYVINMPGNVINIPGNTIDVPGNVNNIHGNFIDIPESVNNMPGSNINVPDNTFDISGEIINVPGNTIDISGNVIDLPGNIVEIQKHTNINHMNPWHTNHVIRTHNYKWHTSNNIYDEHNQSPMFDGYTNLYSNGQLTFDAWLQQQFKKFHDMHVQATIDNGSLKVLIQQVLNRNNIHISADGILTDAHGMAIDVSNLNLRHVLIGSSVAYENLIKGTGYQFSIPTDMPYLEALIVSLINPQRVLGIIPLGKTLIPHVAGSAGSVSKMKVISSVPHYTTISSTVTKSSCRNNNCETKVLSGKLPLKLGRMGGRRIIPGGAIPKIRHEYETRPVAQHNTWRRNHHGVRVLDKNRRQQASKSTVRDIKGADNLEETRRFPGMPLGDILEKVYKLLFGRRQNSRRHFQGLGKVGYGEDYSYDEEKPDFRIIGGIPATGSGTPLSNRGRSGIDA